ncbi:MAG: tRNA 2-thiouridine(34) synthase MnmA [bacterium]|nr:tRNA 2-thiouridine(34) synthase MnmA [bacterium]
MNIKKKVLVAMSGGADSSVAAYLLVKEGYEVIGLTFDLFQSSCQDSNPRTCCSLAAFEDVRDVAEKLGISHYIINLKEEFEREVINYFIKEYLNGKTPNPCVKCNEKIKFATLLNKAKELGADYIATGHYAKVEYDKSRESYLLKKGTDLKKDQSYVLFCLNQNILSKTIFPLGNLKKEEIRKIAKESGLLIHNKPESQEICFIPSNDLRIFFKINKISDKLGHIMDKNGKILGSHSGIHCFTIGQRRGLGIAKGKPLYVIKIDQDKNIVIVGEKKELLKNELTASNVSWVTGSIPNKPITVKAKIRYTHNETLALIIPIFNKKVKVKFSDPQQAITPGQAIVFYKNDVLLGGGWID